MKQYEEISAELPRNRRSAFFQCLRQNRGVFFGLGVLCLMAFLPRLLLLFIKENYVLSLYQALEEPTDQMIVGLQIHANVLFGVFEAISFLILVTIGAGITRISRQLLWGEYTSFWMEFGKGLRENACHFLLLSIPVALLGWGLSCLEITIISVVLYALFFLIVLPIYAWSLLQTVYYQLPVGNTLKNAIAFYLAAPGKTIIMLCLSVTPVYILFNTAVLQLTKYVVLVILPVVSWGMLLLGWQLIGSELFDTYINKEHHPEFYRKGLK